MKPQMQWSYLFKHWFATLLIAPFLCDLFFYINPTNYNIGGLTGVYHIVFIFSFIASIPTYAIYALAFYFLKRENISLIFSKRILLIISMLGVLITFSTGFSTLSIPATLAYILTSLITGIFFKLEK